MTRPPSPTLDMKSTLMLLALAAVWGGTFFFAEIALREVPPLTIALHRIVWAIPVLAVFVVAKRAAQPVSVRTCAAFVVMGALNNAIPFSLIFWGQTQIESGLASILNGTTAMFGAVVAGLLLPDEALTTKKVMGGALGLAGVAIIMGPQTLTGFDPASLAQLAILGATLSYAFAGVWGKRMLSGQPPLVNTLGMLLGSVLVMVPLVLIFDGPPSLALSAQVWGALLAMAVLSTALAYVLYFSVLTRAGAANLLLVTLLIPPFAIGLGVVFLGESLGLNAMIGFAVIATGIIVTDGRVFSIHTRFAPR
ncbi:MAG: DMT family transporter [Pseudomonadota bacterium]